MSVQPVGTVAISATFSAEPVTESLQFWLDRLKLPFTITHSAFNQVFQTLLDPTGIFAGNLGGVNVVLVRWQDLGHGQQLESNAKSLLDTIERASAQLGGPIVVASCPCSPVFLSDPALAGLSAKLDEDLKFLTAFVPNVHLLPLGAAAQLYCVSAVHDAVSEKLAEIPYTADFFAALGTLLARKIASLKRPPFKLIAVDLDNTLWTGVAGEDGWQGVRIEPERLALQQFLLEQREQGALLAICSKNNEKDAWEVFDRRPEMLLKKSHFSAWQINWDPKSVNIRNLANQLSLGSDSFIFLDDDAKECAEMRANAPEVLTLQLPKALDKVMPFVRHVWAFDRGKVTAEDRLRVQSYEQERARAQEAEKAHNLEDFVSALDLQVAIEPFRPEMLARVSQLTQRTNQFNTTTIRRSESELKNVLETGALKCLTVAVTDRFGDYGNVGAVLYSFESSSLAIDSFLLSCRALGRGVEHAILRHLGKEALNHGASELVIKFIASPKNAPALGFIDSLEFTENAGGLYTRLFRVKADYASQLVYRPAGKVELARESAPKPARANENLAPSVDYAELARLNSVSTIRAEIRRSGPDNQNAGVSAGSAIPRNQTETKLAAIWAEVLQRPVGINDDFFELGGNSLRAVQLLVRVVELFDRPDLTLSALVEAPTVAKFAATLGDQYQVRCLVPIRASGSRPPFFCIPGGGGNVLQFRFLVANLPPDQPFWGLQTPGLDGSETIDDAARAAALYIDEIRTIQPHGPYYLGGGCIGGILAYEMAQQLTAQGEQVALLVLIESYNPAFGKMISRARYASCHTRFLGQRILAKGQTIVRRIFTADAEDAENQPNSSAPLNPHSLQSSGENSDEDDPIKRLQRVYDANVRAGKKYVPSPYYGKIAVLRASTRRMEPYQDKYLGWGSVAKGALEVDVIPGRHDGFDHRVFGEVLNRHLLQAQAAASPTGTLNAKPPVVSAGTESAKELTRSEA